MFKTNDCHKNRVEINTTLSKLHGLFKHFTNKYYIFNI